MKSIIFLFFLFIESIFCQEIELFPTGLHFLPFKANYQEARLGVLYYPNNGNLKVDLGNNVDLIKFSLPEKEITLTLAVEFMGYALSTSYEGRRLQIDALDGFFGGNASFSKNFGGDKLISRFRIIHNSAHLVDGHWNTKKDNWINNDRPIPFTKDFGELSLGYILNPNFGYVRIYGTASYASLVRPNRLQKWSTYFGYELAFSDISGNILNKQTYLFLANQYNLIGLPDYKWNINTLLGIKFGKWNEKGVVFYLSYYSGSNPFSEYYSDRVNQFGIGFFVDYF